MLCSDVSAPPLRKRLFRSCATVAASLPLAPGLLGQCNSPPREEFPFIPNLFWLKIHPEQIPALSDFDASAACVPGENSFKCPSV